MLGPQLVFQLATSASRREAGLERHEIKVGDHTIAYLAGGAGEPIVLLHGFGADKDRWTDFARFLTPRYRVVAADMPGFGESSFVAGASYRAADQARRLRDFLDALGLAQVHLAGNSLGGQVAGTFAAMYPDRVLTLALIDCTGVRSPEPSDMVAGLMRGEPLPLVVTTTEEFDRRMTFLFVRPPAIPGFIKQQLVADSRAHAVAHQTILEQTTPEVEALEPELARITARTLVLWGDRDRMRHVSSVPVLQRGLRNSTVVIMRDCGHVPTSERPAEAAEYYLGFLRAEAASP
jgi:pimeloyl-ACP methyl ester carboxylesterase